MGDKSPKKNNKKKPSTKAAPKSGSGAAIAPAAPRPAR